MHEGAEGIDWAAWRQEIRHSWAVLVPPDDDGLRAVVVTHTAHDRPVRLGVDRTGSRHLLVAVGASDQRQAEGPSLSLTVRSYDFDGEVGYHLDLSCRDPDLHDVFDELLGTLLPRLCVSDDPYATVSGCLDRWRELLRRRADQLAHRREMGLFAELYVLDRLAQGSTLDPGWWRGPLREPKDIVTPWAWIEVKASPPGAECVRINGISQLEDMIGLDGYLCIVDVEPADDGTDCEDLARSVAARASDRAAFDALLIMAGLWSGRPAGRWRHGAVTLCPAQSVPRIIPSNLVVPLPAGIRAVTYDVDRSVLDAFSLVRPDSVLASLGGAP